MTPHAQPMTAEQIERIRAAAKVRMDIDLAAEGCTYSTSIQPDRLIQLCELAAKGLAIDRAWRLAGDWRDSAKFCDDDHGDSIRDMAAALEAALSDQSKGLAAQEGEK